MGAEKQEKCHFSINLTLLMHMPQMCCQYHLFPIIVPFLNSCSYIIPLALEQPNIHNIVKIL